MEDCGSACPTCLNLNYDLFEELKPRHYDSFDLSNQLRYHISSINDPSASSQGGCRNCSILYQGITLFWGETGEDEVEEDDDEEADEESIKGIKEDQEQDHENEDPKEHGYEHEDGGQDGNPYRIFIEIRPGILLTVLRTQNHYGLTLW
ncbi:hypothetical protein K432DRAFT_395963 [Lepidopterella palustris CBS 459.81]|uniref:Uncharacterized protein n=1 Tax=Lepidopterella palustris CBS 459.81 TaxID=1314670 RepID=A0A8E2JCI4_9PEZI|nr:hypothetical protein K432DRAFT_395963 [Lepidopterella palustris CBS 459.81]